MSLYDGTTAIVDVIDARFGAGYFHERVPMTRGDEVTVLDWLYAHNPVVVGLDALPTLADQLRRAEQAICGMVGRYHADGFNMVAAPDNLRPYGLRFLRLIPVAAISVYMAHGMIEEG